MKKTYSWALLALLMLVVFASGCIDTDYNVSLMEDGGQAITVKIKAPSGLDAAKIQEMQDDLKNKGYTVAKTTDKDQNIIITGDKKLNAGKWELPYNEKVVVSDPKFTSNFTNYFVYKAWSYEGSYEFDAKKVAKVVGKEDTTATATTDSGMNLEDYSLDFVYVLTVPGTISEQNAASTVANADGTTTLTWKYNTDKDKGVDLKVKSSKTYTMYMGIAGGIVLLLILIPIILKVTKKKTPPPGYPQQDFTPPEENA